MSEVVLRSRVKSGAMARVRTGTGEVGDGGVKIICAQHVGHDDIKAGRNQDGLLMLERGKEISLMRWEDVQMKSWGN